MAMVWSWSSTALPSLRQDAEIGASLTVTDEAWVAAITFVSSGPSSKIPGQGLTLFLNILSLLEALEV